MALNAIVILAARIPRYLVVEVAWKKNKISRFGLWQNVLACIERSDGGIARMVAKGEVRAAGWPHEDCFAGRVRGGQIKDARDETVGVRMQRLVPARLQHVGPHLLDGPAQLFAEQQDAEINKLWAGKLGDLPKQIVVARVGDLRVEELPGAQVAFDRAFRIASTAASFSEGGSNWGERSRGIGKSGSI